jgi:hypothetical protein
LIVINLFGSGRLGRLPGIASIESVDATGRINQFLLARKERVTCGTDFYVQIFFPG